MELPKTRLYQEGFTLVEVMCAIVVLAIMVSILFIGLSNGFAILRTTREDLRATQIMMQKTEAVRLLTWNELSNCPSSFTEYYYPNGVTNNSEGTVYYGVLSATGVDTNIPDSVYYKPDIHLITISLSWTNYVGDKAVAHHREMETLAAKHGMQNYIYGNGL